MRLLMAGHRWTETRGGGGIQHIPIRQTVARHTQGSIRAGVLNRLDIERNRGALDEPARRLASRVMIEALKDLTDPHALPVERKMARRFFSRNDREPIPCNLAFCCEVLGLNVQAVRDGVSKRTYNAELARKALSARTGPLGGGPHS